MEPLFLQGGEALGRSKVTDGNAGTNFLRGNKSSYTVLFAYRGRASEIYDMLSPKIQRRSEGQNDLIVKSRNLRSSYGLSFVRYANVDFGKAIPGFSEFRCKHLVPKALPNAPTGCMRSSQEFKHSVVAHSRPWLRKSTAIARRHDHRSTTSCRSGGPRFFRLSQSNRCLSVSRKSRIADLTHRCRKQSRSRQRSGDDH